MAGEWGVLLNGVYLSGGDATQWQDITGTAACSAVSGVEPAGCLTVPPDGLGLPDMRTEDVTFPQRDGVRHFRDWYEPRIITLEGVQVCPDGCAGCPSAREKVREILNAWSRHCDDTELVIFTDCHGTEPPTGGTGPTTGPFGVRGRPRVAEVTWYPGVSKCAELTLRFDAVDHRLFVLDACGNPGSGEECVSLTPSITSDCRDYPVCYDTDGRWCYDVESGESGNTTIAQVDGDVCSCATLTLHGQLTNPVIENVTNGQKIGYAGIIGAAASPVIIDGEDGTATQDGSPRTHLVTGSGRFCLDPGPNELRMTSFGSTDNGFVEICWRDQVIVA